MPKVTARTVAERAGASVSAVSRAFRPGSPIAPDTRQRILRAAQELSYNIPSDQAFVQAATGTIALVAGDLSNPFYPLVLHELSQEISRRRKQLVLHVAPSERVDEVMQQVLGEQPEGVIVTSIELSSRLAQSCQRRGLPIVLINRTQRDREVNSVCCDNYAGGRLVAQRFIESDRKRIAFLGGLRDTSTHVDRWRGFKDALEDAGRTVAFELQGGYRYDIAFGAVSELFQRSGSIPDAIFCANDIMALAVVDAAAVVGIEVPGAVHIVGFDDIPMAAWQSYRLTTVRQPVSAMVRETVDMIEGLIASTCPPGSSRTIPGQLIVRASG